MAGSLAGGGESGRCSLAELEKRARRGSKRPSRDSGHEVAEACISEPQSGIWGREE